MQNLRSRIVGPRACNPTNTLLYVTQLVWDAESATHWSTTGSSANSANEKRPFRLSAVVHSTPLTSSITRVFRCTCRYFYWWKTSTTYCMHVPYRLALRNMNFFYFLFYLVESFEQMPFVKCEHHRCVVCKHICILQQVQILLVRSFRKMPEPEMERHYWRLVYV